MRWLDADYSAYRNFPPVPARVTGILMWLVRDKFSGGHAMRDPDLARYKWSETTEDSTLIVGFGPAIDYKAIQQRPAVMVIRKGWKFIHGALSIGNRYHGNGEERYASLLSGSHVLNIIAQNPVEAENIAAELYYHLLEFSNTIAVEFNFHRFTLDELGEPVKIDESKEHWSVPILVMSTLQPNWEIKPVGSLFKTVSLNVGA